MLEITSGKIPGAKKVVLYGPEGIGKSTFASKFPDPVFIDTEGSTKEMDVKRVPAPTKWTDITWAATELIAGAAPCKTIVIDTADWAESFCSREVCTRANCKNIEDFGYGKGYVYLAEEFKVLLDGLNEAVKKGINVVITAHAKMRKFEQPDEMGAYDRWEMKLTRQVAPMLKEWADMVLFANYKTYVVEDDKTKSKKAQGGKRVMYTTHNPCWDAKNRYGLPDCVPFEYESIKEAIEGDAPKAKKAPKKEAVKKEEPEQETEIPLMDPKDKEMPDEVPFYYLELKELMDKDHITPDEVRVACANKGAENVMPWEYSEEFIKKSLVAKWASFSKHVKAKYSDVPFIDHWED